MECEHLEGCCNTTRVSCWHCDGPICLEHSNRFMVRTPKGDKRRRVCDDCLNGEVRP